MCKWHWELNQNIYINPAISWGKGLRFNDTCEGELMPIGVAFPSGVVLLLPKQKYNDTRKINLGIIYVLRVLVGTNESTNITN